MYNVMYNALAGCHQNIHPPPPAPVAGIRLQASSLTLAASRVAFAELQSYILPFIFFPSLLPRLPFCLFCASTPAFSSHPRHFSSLILRLHAAFAFVKQILCSARACSTGHGTGVCEGGGGGGGDGRPKTVSQHMLYVSANSPLRPWWSASSVQACGLKKKKKNDLHAHRLSQHKLIFWGLTRRFAVMLNDCLSRYGGIWLQERRTNHERFLWLQLQRLKERLLERDDRSIESEADTFCCIKAIRSNWMVLKLDKRGFAVTV